MKKISIFFLVVFIFLNLSACGGKKNSFETAKSDAEAEDSSVQVSSASGTDLPAEVAEDETSSPDKKADEVKTVYWATKDREPSEISYHKKDCPIIKDKEPKELSWDLIDALGMPACEVCKP